MEIKRKVTPSEQIAWLKTCGHAHKDTVKLIERQHELIRAIMNPELPIDEVFEDASEYLDTFYPASTVVKKVCPDV